MHETMVAESLVTAILAESERQKARPVAARISCGQLNAINDEVLCFAFEAIARETRCQGVKLDVEHKSMQGRCKKCGEVFEFDIMRPGCVECGGGDFELLPDAPLLLEEIEFETE